MIKRTPAWNPSMLPARDERVFAVTGATSGIGYFVAEQLATTGARIVLMGRSPERLERAKREIALHAVDADLDSVVVDLADLRSVERAGEVLSTQKRLDGLVANAGLVAVSKSRKTTAQGLELAMGVNHLGHFALVGAVLPLLLATPGSRVVSAGSYITSKFAFDTDDLLSEKQFHPRRAYAQSKHATEVFGFELHRRLQLAGAPVSSVVAHPGGALEQMTPARPGIAGATHVTRAVYSVAAGLAQGKDRGAWPLVRALTDPHAAGGEYYGPAHRTHGLPVRTDPVASSKDADVGRWLWSISEELTGRTAAV